MEKIVGEKASKSAEKQTQSNARQTDGNIIWIDLEMTGLNHKQDVILEIACVVTNGQLEIIAEGPNLVVHQPESALQKMDTWCTNTHTKSGLIQKVRNSTTTLQEAEQQILGFLRSHCQEGKSPLGGNSVWMDRLFLMEWMPRLAQFLHYRTIDVSTIKELSKSWFPKQLKETKFKKKNAHRALDDVIESIEELRYYRKLLFKDAL